MPKLSELNIDPSWSLFLDRDGVINRRLQADYIKTPEEFELLEGVAASIAKLNQLFGHTFIVTNQQGIGKGLMSTKDLDKVHKKMLEAFALTGASIHKIYHAPQLRSENHPDRKPGTGMARQAQQDFPKINMSKSIMVGDSFVDMMFGKRAGMITVLVNNRDISASHKMVDYKFENLQEFTAACLESI